MNSRPRMIIRLLQVLFWIAAALGVAAFTWLALNRGAGQNVEILSEPSNGQTADPIALVVVFLFWLVFLALVIEFLAREVFRRGQRRQMGRVLLAIGHANVARNVISVLAALIFVVGFNLIVFEQVRIDVEPNEMPLAGLLTFWLFYGISHFLFIAFLLRALRNRPFFLLTDKGFLYEPGDVAPGLISWKDVAEVKEVELVAKTTGFGGARLSVALAVGLKNPAAYKARYSPPLRALDRLLTKFLRFQTEGPSDIVLAAEDFGPRYEEVKKLIMDKVKEP